MEELQRSALLLRGFFTGKTFEGARTINYIFKDTQDGWYSVTAVKEDSIHEQIQLGETCDIKVNVTGKIKTTDNRTTCFNDLILKTYEPQTNNIKGDK